MHEPDMPTRLPRGLLPFRHAQYRILCAGLVLAMFADGIWTVGMVWQVIELGGGAAQLSVVTATGAVGMVGSTLLGGVLADRISQRTILIVLETVKMAAVGLVALIAATGGLQTWHLVIAQFVGGVTIGIYYPTYSALLPSVVAADDLLAANGIEGALRPMVLQAAGPAMAGGLIAIAAPSLAIGAVAMASGATVLVYLLLRPVPVHREPDDQRAHPVRQTLRDLGEGFGYMRRTPWLLATLLFASVLVFVVMGPLEVLVPFAIKDRAGGDAGSHAMVLAAFGIGSAVGALSMASRTIPRHYLTFMVGLWGLSATPFLVMGFATHTWLFVIAGFAMGVAFDVPTVIWGTLLQRRVPREMLGRISSLDFFVSLLFMPISVAVAAPISELIGLTTTFVLAALIPIPVAVAAIWLARLRDDELAHPLAKANTESVGTAGMPVDGDSAELS